MRLPRPAVTQTRFPLGENPTSWARNGGTTSRTTRGCAGRETSTTEMAFADEPCPIHSVRPAGSRVRCRACSPTATRRITRARTRSTTASSPVPESLTYAIRPPGAIAVYRGSLNPRSTRRTCGGRPSSRVIAPAFVCATTARDPCASMLRGPSSVRTLRCRRPEASDSTPTNPSVSAVASASAGRDSWARRTNGEAIPAARNSRRSTGASAPSGAPRELLGRRQRLGLRHDLVLAPAQPLGGLAVAQDAAGEAGGDRVGRDRLRDDRVRPDHGVVADRHAAQDAGPVAHPHVVADVDVALVDPLFADRALDLDDAVIEVDEHHAVGDDALAPDRHVLERADGALLPDHRLGTDDDLALVRADLRAVADPGPAAEHDARPLADLEVHPGAHEADAVGLQPAAPAQLEPRPARDEERVLRREHAVGSHEPQDDEWPAVQGRRLAADDDVGRRHRRRWGQDGLHDRDAKDAPAWAATTTSPSACWTVTSGPWPE